MTPDMLRTALRGFARRRPFLPYQIEFMSGDRIRVIHPEAVAPVREFFVYRSPDRSRRIFAADAVCQFIDDGAVRD